MNQYKQVIENFFKDFQPNSISKNTLDEYYKHPRERKYLSRIKIINNKPIFHANEGEKRGRYKPVVDLIKKVTQLYNFKDTEFLVNTGDGTHSDVPCFGVIRTSPEKPKGVIPFPVGNSNGMKQGFGTPIVDWDKYIDEHIVQIGKKYDFKSKINKVAWRGSFKMITWAAGKYTKKRIESWRDCTRSKLYFTTKDREDIFDVGITGISDKYHSPVLPVPDEVYDLIKLKNRIPFPEMQKYVGIMDVGNVCEWSERIRKQLYMNSVMIMQEQSAQEFFTPLLKPFIHYVPAKGDWSDLIEVGQWVINNPEEVKKIIENANQFAYQYLCEKSMYEYTKMAIEKYTTLLNYKPQKIQLKK